MMYLSNLPSSNDNIYARLDIDTIATGIKIVTDELAKERPPGTKINVWFTGHSLGTAVATLAYSKALLSKDIGSNALLRDAYLFATPVVVSAIGPLLMYLGDLYTICERRLIHSAVTVSGTWTIIPCIMTLILTTSSLA
jgi:hypothetical protein